MWNVKVTPKTKEATGTISQSIRKSPRNTSGKHITKLEKAATLGTVYMLLKLLI
jgi:hypothetical protein